jgi:thioredoxin-dependent peroxiredoxin
LAEYRDHYREFRQAGADLAAVSVDEPEKSEGVRERLKLPFPILCDTKRALLTAWGILNEKERGGIAIPSIFVVDRDLSVRFASIDRVAARVPASAVADIARSGAKPAICVSRRRVFPHPKDFLRALKKI